MRYDITQSAPHVFRVGVAREESDGDHCIGHFTSLREAQAFIGRMAVLDAGASHGLFGERKTRSSPAALRDLSRVLLAHGKVLRSDAEQARVRAQKCRRRAQLARDSSVTSQAFSVAAQGRQDTR
jgi:hypothetical protein